MISVDKFVITKLILWYLWCGFNIVYTTTISNQIDEYSKEKDFPEDRKYIGQKTYAAIYKIYMVLFWPSGISTVGLQGVFDMTILILQYSLSFIGILYLLAA